MVTPASFYPLPHLATSRKKNSRDEEGIQTYLMALYLMIQLPVLDDDTCKKHQIYTFLSACSTNNKTDRDTN